MVREALRDRFLAVLAESGGTAGNGRLQTERGWNETTYLRAASTKKRTAKCRS